MPKITHEFVVTGEGEEVFRALRRLGRNRAWSPVASEATEPFRSAWGDWLDYLSPGDAVRVVWLRMAMSDDHEATQAAAKRAYEEYRRVAEERKAALLIPGDTAEPSQPAKAAPPAEA